MTNNSKRNETCEFCLLDPCMCDKEIQEDEEEYLVSDEKWKKGHE